MGQFSWLDCKTGEQILDNVRRDVYVLLPDGGHIKETCYDGYGNFGGRDAYALLAWWNAPELCVGDDDVDREVGIRLFYDDHDLKYPLKITHDPHATYDECEASPDDPNQGWLMDEEETVYMKLCLCRYCYEEMKSRGEQLFEAGSVTEGKCDRCDEEDDVIEYLWEVE